MPTFAVFAIIASACEVVIPTFAVLVETSDFIEFNDESTVVNLVLIVDKLLVKSDGVNVNSPEVLS